MEPAFIIAGALSLTSSCVFIIAVWRTPGLRATQHWRRTLGAGAFGIPGLCGLLIGLAVLEHSWRPHLVVGLLWVYLAIAAGFVVAALRDRVERADAEDRAQRFGTSTGSRKPRFMVPFLAWTVAMATVGWVSVGGWVTVAGVVYASRHPTGTASDTLDVAVASAVTSSAIAVSAFSVIPAAVTAAAHYYCGLRVLRRHRQLLDGTPFKVHSDLDAGSTTGSASAH